MVIERDNESFFEREWAVRERAFSRERREKWEKGSKGSRIFCERIQDVSEKLIQDTFPKVLFLSQDSSSLLSRALLTSPPSLHFTSTCYLPLNALNRDHRLKNLVLCVRFYTKTKQHLITLESKFYAWSLISQKLHEIKR